MTTHDRIKMFVTKTTASLGKARVAWEGANLRIPQLSEFGELAEHRFPLSESNLIAPGEPCPHPVTVSHAALAVYVT